MTEHEQLEKITDIVRDYTDSEEAMKEIDGIIFGQYEEQRVGGITMAQGKKMDSKTVKT